MKTADIVLLKNWFNEYVQEYYGSHTDDNLAIRLKEQHSRRVSGYMRAIARALQWPENEIRMAEAAGLLHDVGRFPQWRMYRTYNDSQSVDHGDLSLSVIIENRLLSSLSANKKEILETAVVYHNKRDVPTTLTASQCRFARMLRDADKLDIWHVVIRNEYNPDAPKALTRMIRGDLPNPDSFSIKMLQDMLKGNRPDIHDIRVQNDFTLFRLSWILDINYAPAAHTILKRKYVNKLIKCLPQSHDVQTLEKQLNSYLQRLIQPLKG